MKISYYVDTGQFFATYINNTCMNWYPEPININQAKLDDFLNPWFSQLVNIQVDTIILSFAQINDLLILGSGKAGDSLDTITPIIYSGNVIEHDASGKPSVYGKYLVGTTGQDALQYFIAGAHKNNLKVMVAFGGEEATSVQMTFPSDPKTVATDLANFLKSYEIDGVDFDIEGSGLTILTANDVSDVITFFQTLKGFVTSSTLTVAGALSSGPIDNPPLGLNPLFSNLNSCFTGVNLMLYSTNQYYLDADNVTWGIKQWLSYVSPSMLHVGFYDAIAYEQPSASAGEQYSIPSQFTRGEAAAWVYQQVLKQVGNPSLGNPFFWTDKPQNLTNTTTNPPTAEIISDFYNTITNPNIGNVTVTVPAVSGLTTLPGPVVIGGVSFPITAYGSPVTQEFPVGSNYPATAPSVIQGTTLYQATVTPSVVNVTKGDTTNVVVNYTGAPLQKGTLGIQIQSIANLPLQSLPEISVAGAQFSFTNQPFNTLIKNLVVPGTYTIEPPTILVGDYQFTAKPVVVTVSANNEVDVTIVYTSVVVEQVTATVTVTSYSKTSAGLALAFQTTGSQINPPWTALISGNYTSLGSTGYGAAFSVANGVITADVTASWNSIKTGVNAQMGVTVEGPSGANFVPTSVTVNGSPCNIALNTSN
jgi:hypothetical protein